MEPREISISLQGKQVRIYLPGEQKEPEDRISFWWNVTPSAIALAEYLTEMNDLAGKRAIELGCGPGLPGVTTALLGAEVLFTDYMPEALKLARRNAFLNGVPESMIDCQILDWENSPDLPRFDIVMGSEILYEYYFHGALIKLFQNILGRNGAILLADRKRLAVSRFIGRAKRAGFISSENRRRTQQDGFPGGEIAIYCLGRPNDSSL